MPNFIDFFLLYLLITLTDFTHCSGVTIVEFEQINNGLENANVVELS